MGASARRYASETLRADPEVVIAAVQCHWSALHFASEELLQEPLIVMALVQQWMKTSTATSSASLIDNSQSCTEANAPIVAQELRSNGVEACTGVAVAPRRTTRAQRL